MCFVNSARIESSCALPDIKAAELGEALRSLGLVLTQKELSDMKVPWPQ